MLFPLLNQGRDSQKFLSENNYFGKISATVLNYNSIGIYRDSKKEFLLKNCLTFRQHRGGHKYYLSNDYYLSVT